MKQERPSNALTWRFWEGRARAHPDGPWVKRTAYEEWREYALALESQIRQRNAKYERDTSLKPLDDYLQKLAIEEASK